MGKTTTAVNLAAALAARTAQEGDPRGVLLLDFDPSANATAMLGAPKKSESIVDTLLDAEATPLEAVIYESCAPGVHIARGHKAMSGLDLALQDEIGKEFLLRELLAPMRARFAFILIDNGPQMGLPPALSLVAADMVIVPVEAKPLTMEGIKQVGETIAKARARLNPNLQKRIVMTMVDGRNGHSRPMAAQVRGLFPGEVFETEIGYSAELERGVLNKDRGGAVVSYAPNSQPARWFDALAAEVMALSIGFREAPHGA